MHPHYHLYCQEAALGIFKFWFNNYISYLRGAYIRGCLYSGRAYIRDFTVFRDVKEEDVVDEYIENVRFVQVYFDLENIDQCELWHKILLQCEDTK